MDDDLFFAWLDGELDPETAARVAAQVACDPELQHKADTHRAMQARLRNAFEPLLAAPPLAPNVVDLGAARERRSSRRMWPATAQWAAIAATLVVGIVAGTMIGGGGDASGRTGSGQMLASGPLERALDAQLASAPAADGPRIGLTFRDEAGAICRSFTDGSAQGLACRDGDDWALHAFVRGENAGSGELRMAAGVDPAVAATIESLMAGEPFDAGAEREARDRGWR